MAEISNIKSRMHATTRLLDSSISSLSFTARRDAYIQTLYHCTCNCHSNDRSHDTPCYSIYIYISPHLNCFFGNCQQFSQWTTKNYRTERGQKRPTKQMSFRHTRRPTVFGCARVCVSLWLSRYRIWVARSCTVTVADAHMVGVYIP